MWSELSYRLAAMAFSVKSRRKKTLSGEKPPWLGKTPQATRTRRPRVENADSSGGDHVGIGLMNEPNSTVERRTTLMQAKMIPTASRCQDRKRGGMPKV